MSWLIRKGDWVVIPSREVKENNMGCFEFYSFNYKEKKIFSLYGTITSENTNKSMNLLNIIIKEDQV